MMSSTSTKSSGKILEISLWIAQVLMFVAFLIFSYIKLTMPPEALVSMWGSQWPVQHPMLLRFTGGVDAVGGLGILLPALTRVGPRLGVLAALGCIILQIAAIVFHVSRGEFAGLPLNFVLLAFVSFIFWGRAWRAPVEPRGVTQ